MGAFFSSLFSELGARRERMRAAFGDRTATMIEFIFFGGLVLGVVAAAFGEMRGLAAVASLIVGYVLLDLSRQRAMAAGIDEEITRKRQDRLAFILFAALSLMGAAFCFYALGKDEIGAAPPPGKSYDVNVQVSPS